ncbi:MAG: archaeosortase/exosortase family protein, partial [Candidatus Thiodiazotropha taylori]
MKVYLDNINLRVSNTILVLLLTVSLLLYGFWQGIVDMLKIWSNKEEYGYAYFLPIISAYLIWQRRPKLYEAGFKASWFGVLII